MARIDTPGIARKLGFWKTRKQNSICVRVDVGVITTTNGTKILVSKEDVHKVWGVNWQVLNTGYVFCYKPGGGRIMLSSLIVGSVPKGKYVDHINGNILDNRRCNLRITTPAQNAWNRKKPQMGASSRCKGINWYPKLNKWCARITHKTTRYHLGYFNTEEEAAAAYKDAATKYHGEYMRLI